MLKRLLITSGVVFSLAFSASGMAAEKHKSGKATAAKPAHHHIDDGGGSEARVRLNLIAPNDGWRWVYRKKVFDILKAEVYQEDRTTLGAFRDTLGLKARDRDGLVREAGPLITSLTANGETKKAELLKRVIAFFITEKNDAELELHLKEYSDDPLGHLGYFLLGSHHEKTGFHPEAMGFYARIIKSPKPSPAKAAALFSKGRLLYFNGKLEKALVPLKEAEKEGYADAPLWIANSYSLRGEIGAANSIYRRLEGRDLDPVTLLGMGEASLLGGDYERARVIFEGLRGRYRNNELLWALFNVKAGDAFLAEGRYDDSLAVYTRTKEKGKGEEHWAIATLSLADLLYLKGDMESLAKAEKLYQAIAEANFTGSEISCLSLISTRTRLGKYEEAMADIKAFPSKYPTSALRSNLDPLRGTLVHNWINSLYEAGDSYGAVKVASIYGAHIPFGKKSETFLKAGKSALELGLTAEASKNLDAALKLGNNSVAEEAMLALAKVYIRQEDSVSAEKICDAFISRFPKSRYIGEIQAIQAQAAYLKGDYGRAGGLKWAGDGESLYRKALSLSLSGKPREAAVIFEKALRSFEAEKNAQKIKDTLIGLGDASFSQGDYGKASQWYGKAVEAMGEDKGRDRSWALYRLALCYSRLDRNEDKSRTLKALKEQGDDIGRWSDPILRDARSL